MAENKQPVPTIWTTGWTDTLNTGTWRSSFPQHENRPAPCHGACPVSGEIPVWIQHVREGSYQEAFQTLVDNNPFPAIIGRVCHHPCENKCNRGQYDGAVAINALEQFVGDLALEKGWSLPEISTDLGKTAAVIGGGPAGLACAYQLRRRGYRVTIYEARPELGGMLRYGIPRFRLPLEVLEGEINRLLSLGFEVKTGWKVKPEELLTLQKNHAAVFLAIGAQQARKLPQFPEDKRVFDALNFLTEVNQGNHPALGSNVTVIGGGSVAMDVARTAKRLGRQVKVLPLEDNDHLPALPDDVREALEEGVTIQGGVLVQGVNSSGQRLKLNCTRVVMDPSVQPGEIKPVIISADEFLIETDNVILAVGQDVDLDGWKNQLQINKSIIETGSGCSTSFTGVFAGGDAVSLERFVSAAIGYGNKAAEEIDQWLREEQLFSSPANPDMVRYEEINTFYFPLVPRTQREHRNVQDRVQDFAEVNLGFTEEQTRQQGERCFSCGNCIQCDNCFYFCPDMAVVKEPTLKEHYRVLDQYCKGCGCCAEECPRGAVVLKEESR